MLDLALGLAFVVLLMGIFVVIFFKRYGDD